MKSNKLKIVLILIAFIISQKVLGQNYYFGMLGGINISKENTNTFPDSRKGYLSGITYFVEYQNKVNIELNILYDQKGFSDLHSLTMYDRPYTVEYRYNYISLPVKIGYKFGNIFFIIPRVGLSFSYLKKAEYTTTHYVPFWKNNEGTAIIDENTEWKYTKNSYDITNEINEGDLTILFDICAGYKISDRIEIYTSFSYNKGITYFMDEMKHKNFTFSFGTRIKFLEKKI